MGAITGEDQGGNIGAITGEDQGQLELEGGEFIQGKKMRNTILSCYEIFKSSNCVWTESCF